MALVDHLDKLRAFRIAAETGTLREAAMKLNLAQPSLTRLIQTLEHETGSALLHRSRQGVALTQAGKILFDYAVTTLSGLDDLEIRLKNPGESLAGRLKVASYESLAEYLWPDFIVTFSKKAPSLRLTIRTRGAHSLAQLEDGTVDILMDAEPRLVGEFTSWVLYGDRYNFYMRKAAKLSPGVITEFPLIFVPSAKDQEKRGIVRLLEEQGYDFKEKIELDSFTAVKTFCQRGLGLGVLPIRLAEEAHWQKQLALASLSGFSQKGFGAHTLYATVLSTRVDDPRLKFLIRELKGWFKGPA